MYRLYGGLYCCFYFFLHLWYFISTAYPGLFLLFHPCDITLLVDMPYLLAEFIRVVFQFIDG